MATGEKQGMSAEEKCEVIESVEKLSSTLLRVDVLTHVVFNEYLLQGTMDETLMDMLTELVTAGGKQAYLLTIKLEPPDIPF